MCIARPKFQLCKIILKYVYCTVYSRLNICSLIEINFSLCKLFIFLNILSLSQEIISVYFNYPFSGIKTQKPDKTLCLIAMLIIYRYTISINFLHMFCRVPDVSGAISNTFSKLLNIHAVCEDSCRLILQIHGYSHSCILNCITILYFFSFFRIPENSYQM